MPSSQSSVTKPRVLVADDNEAMRETVVSLLAPDFEIVGAVGDGGSALEAAVRLQPEVAVLDISMPSLNGIQAAERMNGYCPTKVVFLTAIDDPEIAKRRLPPALWATCLNCVCILT